MLQRNLSQFHPLMAAILLVTLLQGNSVGRLRAHDQGSYKAATCLKRNGVSRRYGRPVRLTPSQLMDRVIVKRPVERPGSLGKNNLQGVVVIEVLIDKRGKVVCVHGVDGHPIAIGAAMRSAREWTFRPYFIGRIPKSVSGMLTIPYNFGS